MSSTTYHSGRHGSGAIHITSILRKLLLFSLMGTAWLSGNADVTNAPNSIVAALHTNKQTSDIIDFLNKNPNSEEYYRYYSGPSTEPIYLEVDIKDGGLTVDNDKDLVVCLKRHYNEFTDAHPTAFRVMGLFGDDTDNWQPLFNVYFIFRGEKTFEYSTRIPVNSIWVNNIDGSGVDLAARQGKALTKMRFYVTATNRNSAWNENNYPQVALHTFDVITLGKDDSYPNNFKDRFHLNSDYYVNLKNYEFVNTRGVTDTPHTLNWVPDNQQDPETWTEWTENDKELLEAAGIDYADFEFITSATPKAQNPYKLAEGQKRQATHTIEHVIYAMPGDPVYLYPYYGFPTAHNFNENFSHWYDFETGGRLQYEAPWSDETYDLLDFLVDPSKIQISDNYGFYGGYYMNPGTPSDSEVAKTNDNLGEVLSNNNKVDGIDVMLKDDNKDNETFKNRRRPGTTATFLFPRNPYKDAFNQELPREYIIAADFSQTFQFKDHVDVDNKTIKEPVIAFRHIFRICDGRAFAESFSSTLEKNREYISRHQRRVTARAEKSFQIRLESPLPDNAGKRNEKNDENLIYRGYANYYYKMANGGYNRVAGYQLQVINNDTKKVLPNNGGFDLGMELDMNKMRERDIDGRIYSIGDGNFKYRLMLTNNKPQEGNFTVRIIGKDDAGNVIKLNSANDQSKSDDLIVMEFNINFLSNDGASMLTQEELYSDDNKYEYAREEYMNEHYGKPEEYIHFDDYFNLNKLDENNRKKFISQAKYNRYENRIYYDGTTSNTANGMEKTFFKWPVKWGRSTYSFGYNYRQDYGMYMLATHSDNVPYHAEADNYDKNFPDDGNGLFDRRYYRTLRYHNADVANNVESPTPIEQGYFYYVNAASDPGVTARLNIHMPCPGSRIIVSAWVAEFSPVPLGSDDVPANISFNFVAVLDNGERIVLHSFITGDMRVQGEWLNIYYSFVPRLAEFSKEDLSKQVDHYELELDNNAQKSAGADYAIDDIRAFVVPPTVDTDQLSFACTSEKIKMKLSVPFETLLEKAGVQEATGDTDGGVYTLYYTYIDKERYDELYDEKVGNLEEAFEASVVKFDYNSTDGKDHTYGSVDFNVNFKKNTPYPKDNDNTEVIPGKAYRDTDKSEERIIVFENTINPTKLQPGKEYYVVFKTSREETPEGYEGSFFNVNEDCTNKCVTVIRPLHTVKIDGVIVKEQDKMMICENQSPMIQVNIWGKNDATGEFKEIEKNARFDWFYGSLNEFDSYCEEGNSDHTLKEALSIFRQRYSKAESLAGIEPDKIKPEMEEFFEKWMFDLIEKAITPTREGANPKLTLYQASYVLPQIDIPYGEKESRSRIVAIPLPSDNLTQGYTLCTSPTELVIRIGNKTPILRHGLTAITSYPDDMDDVPLRIGIDQVKDHSLIMPVRRVASSDDKTATMKRVKEIVKGSEVKKEGCLFLVQTNDPEYKTLGTAVTENGEEKDVEDGMLWVGEIIELQASTVIGAQNLFKAEFKDDFKFKEGYFYRMRFQFEEVPNEVSSTAEENEDQTVVCKGQDVFTLKIVPKYLLWTGDKNLNWNNDANWRRMASNELYSNKASGEHKHYVTDGRDESSELVNSRIAAYAPLDFTNVVIDKSVEAPYLYGIDKTEVADFYKPTVKQDWSASPAATPEVDADKYADYPQKEEGTGQPTALVEFDMAAFYLDKDNEDGSTTIVEEVGCRPWYANTCSDIHFKPGGTIMNQQALTYERAWVDVELDPSRWYTLAMPLKEVFAGDFYLPTNGARQVTELFQEIEFDNKLEKNNRFRPAVYQRGWDKSEARVYELENQSFDAPRNVAIKTFWSHVYNDVTEKYGSGVGFSVKTDVSDLSSDEWKDENGKVMFRFPKADKEYWYFSKAGDPNIKGHKTSITETRNYKLNDAETGTITVKTASEGNYFLVGNPFMTYLDIQKFLTDTENAKKVEGKFWIVTGTGQVAGSLTDDAVTVADPETTDALVVSDPSAIAPMQGFFVKAKSAATQLELRYDKSMMRRYESSGSNRLTAATRSGAAGQTLRIVSENDGIPASAALLTENAYANNNNMVETLDNGDLGIRSTVYTVGNGKALSINSCEDAEGMEIGVIANPEEVTTLRFEGELATGEYSLYDKASGSLTSLYEGMEYEVTGPVSGRLFLTRSASLAEIDGGISWTASNGLLEVTDNAATGLLKVRVIDTLGRVIRETSTEGQQVSITLPTGIYVAEVVTATASKTLKLRL